MTVSAYLRFSLPNPDTPVTEFAFEHVDVDAGIVSDQGGGVERPADSASTSTT
jgi:hypothetical protein